MTTTATTTAATTAAATAPAETAAPVTTAPATTAPAETTAPVVQVSELLSIKELNTSSEVGSHAEDDYRTAYMEINFRETVDLRSATTGYSRYDNAYYPRVKKIRDDLYLLLYMYGSLGPHLYWSTSTDGVKWNAPQVLFDNRTSDKVIAYTDGPLAGTTDRYCATGADACVLDNGDILCVYAVRPNKGYHDYPDYSGLWMRRGTANANGTVTWDTPEKIYTGHTWEPYIRQDDNGQVEIYWTSIVAYATMYGFDVDKRSTCTMQIVSKDRGATWTPNIQAGDKNNYVATRVYQEYIGNKVPYGNYKESVPYFGGQMPCVTQLYNGKLMISLEVQQLDQSFDISYAVSEADGVWKELGLLEEGPDTSVRSTFDGASPYLSCFPSGEVYLTYGDNKNLKYKLGAPDGSEVAAKGELAAPGTYGVWGSCELLGSHEMLNVAHNKVDGKYGVQLTHAYLNHRTNAPKTTIQVDGYTNDWTDNTDALFVGSQSQAQITLRTAHDDENVYFLVSRLDNYLMTGDTATILIADEEDSYYRMVFGIDGTVTVTRVSGKTSKKIEADVQVAVKLFGTVDDNSDTDEGMLLEIAVPKAAVGLADKTSFRVCPMLANKDKDGSSAVMDTMTVSTGNTTYWPSVVLD